VPKGKPPSTLFWDRLSRASDLDFVMTANEKPGAEAVAMRLERRGVCVFNYENWSMLDRAEIFRGTPKGKPREKFTRIDEMLAASAKRPAHLNTEKNC
jgi:hypothetical protein